MMTRLRETASSIYRTSASRRKRGDWLMSLAQSSYAEWACDLCITKRRAVQANPKMQTYGYGAPYFAYVDRQYVCAECKRSFTFSAKEQRHWYEELKFYHNAYPQECVDCRRKQHEQVRLSRQLSEALHSLDDRDSRQMFAIAQIYEQMSNSEKAVLFYRRAKNLERDEKKRQSIEQHIERLLSENEPSS